MEIPFFLKSSLKTPLSEREIISGFDVAGQKIVYQHDPVLYSMIYR